MVKLTLSASSATLPTVEEYFVDPFKDGHYALHEVNRVRDCPFCSIAYGEDPGTNLLYKDDNYVAFRSIKPAASHHYLVIPKDHIGSAVGLKPFHIPMLEQMEMIGREMLGQQGAKLKRSRLGYHWPPFISVPHLHLHAISPEEELSMQDGILFWPGTQWFRTTDEVISKLNA